jgi:hypothetical protein
MKRVVKRLQVQLVLRQAQNRFQISKSHLRIVSKITIIPGNCQNAFVVNQIPLTSRSMPKVVHYAQ